MWYKNFLDIPLVSKLSIEKEVLNTYNIDVKIKEVRKGQAGICPFHMQRYQDQGNENELTSVYC